MRARDDFPAAIIRLLADRAGHRCSNPACRCPTIGPSSMPDRAVNLGVAAHITGAARGGPRYDEHLTADQRRSAENGVWLCQTCAKLIDSDETRFTVELLRSWKEGAEANAAKSAGAPA